MNHSLPQQRDLQSLIDGISQGDRHKLARAISLVENEAAGWFMLLEQLDAADAVPVIGITGPPGVGKSTLADALIGHWVQEALSVAVLCIDPSSPFHSGAILGDRIRMSDWFNHPQVYIRSLATRGSLGGLNARVFEITDLLRSAKFDRIIIETVGVGQNEVDIAALADTTVVVLVPETGDDVQALKSGLLEIADIFAVNKSDRPDADKFVHHLQSVALYNDNPEKKNAAIVKTVAVEKKGIRELAEEIKRLQVAADPERSIKLLAERAYQLIARQRMHDIDRTVLREQIRQEAAQPSFNLYRFVASF